MQKWGDHPQRDTDGVSHRHTPPQSAEGAAVSVWEMWEVVAVGKRCKSLEELSRELDLWWRGYFLVDDKHVGVRGKDLSWYLGRLTRRGTSFMRMS